MDNLRDQQFCTMLCELEQPVVVLFTGIALKVEVPPGMVWARSQQTVCKQLANSQQVVSKHFFNLTSNRLVGFMKLISVILVSGSGSEPSISAGRTVELLHTNGSRICSLPDLPFYREHHTQTGLTACGGGGDDASKTSCHTLSSTASWEQSHNLAQARGGHSAWRSPQGVMLIGGPDDSDADITTEILTENGDTIPGFNLDYSTR